MALVLPRPFYVDISDFTAAYLKKNYLIGFKFVDGNGVELEDSVYEHWLSVAVATLETKLSIAIWPVDVIDEKHEYYVEDYVNYAFVPLEKWPVRDVTEVSIHYAPDKKILVYPHEWLRIHKSAGQLQLIPTLSQSAPLSIVGFQSSWVPFILNIYSNKFPQYWYVSYSAGFDNKIPADVADAIFKLAVTDMYILMGVTAVPIGVASESVSVDGLSQSRSYNEPFKAVLDRYNKSLYGTPGNPNDPGIIANLVAKYKGVMIESL